ncbi:MAG: 4'-phosphopantetheinyl transferase superfamily protein [Lachnospiraceae bacterium]|nr:4'-phosphopantetheinyl transferase superfamily protein [Lachnospiraceae bacterium]
MKIYYCRDLRQEKSLHSLAYLLLEEALKREYPGLAFDQPVSYGKKPMGKPYLVDYPEIFFNISHCPRCVACVLGTAEVGIDVERRFEWKNNLASRICHEAEWAELEHRPEAEKKDGLNLLWSWKESYMKMLGTGIRSDLRKVDFSGMLREALAEESRRCCRDKKKNFYYNLQTEEFTLVCCGREKLTGMIEVPHLL